jgi:hypothetical protein
MSDIEKYQTSLHLRAEIRNLKSEITNNCAYSVTRTITTNA